MPSIWKRRSHPEVKPYEFPLAEELEPKTPEEQPQLNLQEEGEALLRELNQPEEKQEPEENYAEVQAQQILQDAKVAAEAILAEARSQAASVLEAAKAEVKLCTFLLSTILITQPLSTFLDIMCDIYIIATKIWR